MTSEQVRLILTLLTVVAATCLAGCAGRGPDPATIAPYGSRQVWAVVPLRNESGSRFADSYRIADRLVWEFEEIQGIDVLPVNRVLQAMQAQGLQAVTTREDALALREVLGVDGLIVGSITAYDPYDPLRLGLSLDLYTGARAARRPLDIRGLSWAPTSDAAGIQRDTLYRDDQPVATVSGVFTASSPAVKERIEDYAEDRGTFSNEDHHRRLITIDMNLYTEFVSHEIGSQLIWAEWQRSARETAQSATQQRADAQEPPASP